MYIADIPPHDLSAEFVVLTERRRVEAEMAKRLQVRQPRSASRLLLPRPTSPKRLSLIRPAS